ncbi:MAG TPA: hypothetical protein VGQ95_00435 [Chthoniobacterales bacterium]|nr:hypothetical protein [Chthoniobacterales bacterium]
MPYFLNPNLVREPRRVRDEYVFLCDPTNVGPELFDVPIGKVEVREILEDSELANALGETEQRIPRALNPHFGLTPQVFRTRGCFGRSADEPVTIVVHSRHPVLQKEQ